MLEFSSVPVPMISSFPLIPFSFSFRLASSLSRICLRVFFFPFTGSSFLFYQRQPVIVFFTLAYPSSLQAFPVASWRTFPQSQARAIRFFRGLSFPAFSTFVDFLILDQKDFLLFNFRLLRSFFQRIDFFSPYVMVFPSIFFQKVPGIFPSYEGAILPSLGFLLVAAFVCQPLVRRLFAGSQRLAFFFLVGLSNKSRSSFFLPPSMVISERID